MYSIDRDAEATDWTVTAAASLLLHALASFGTWAGWGLLLRTVLHSPAPAVDRALIGIGGFVAITATGGLMHLLTVRYIDRTEAAGRPRSKDGATHGA